MGSLFKKKDKSLFSFRYFHEKKGEVLIYRSYGGLGDILMHRMIFEDFKKLDPSMTLTFACPIAYHEALVDHPYLDRVVDSKKVDLNDYVISYNTSSACCRHENFHAPYSNKNRSDIWANHCGIELINHNMHLSFTEEEINWGKNTLKTYGWKGEKIAAFCTVSAMAAKNLLPHQAESVVTFLRNQGFFVFSTHNKEIDYFKSMQVPVITGLGIRDWMKILAASDYIISVDSAAFHFAGGIGKPLTGIFTWADGKVYGKHYDFILVQRHRDNGDWPCGPCYSWGQCPLVKSGVKPCLTSLTGEMLVDGVKKMLEKWDR